MYSLYILSCDGRVLYTGITTDVARRLREHAAGRGAKALRRFKKLEIVYQVEVGDRGTATQLEYRLKRLSRPEKDGIVAHQPDLISLCQLLNLEIGQASPVD